MYHLGFASSVTSENPDTNSSRMPQTEHVDHRLFKTGGRKTMEKTGQKLTSESQSVLQGPVVTEIGPMPGPTVSPFEAKSFFERWQAQPANHLVVSLWLLETGCVDDEQPFMLEKPHQFK